MAETRDFLLEIGTEEMPSAPLMNAQKQLGTIIERGMAETGLAHGGRLAAGSVDAYAHIAQFA